MHMGNLVFTTSDLGKPEVCVFDTDDLCNTYFLVDVGTVIFDLQLRVFERQNAYCCKQNMEKAER